MALLETSEPLYSEIRLAVPWGCLAGRWYGNQLMRPIVALHGWLDNCGTFAKLAPLLSSQYSLLCLDLPGHGYSSHLPAGVQYSALDYVRSILYVMKAYKWEKIALMGHSMGGSIMFHFAAFYPERVDILIGLDIVKMIYFKPHIVPLMLHHITEKALLHNDRIMNQNAMNEPPSYSFNECETLLYQGSEQSVDLENCKYILERNITKSTKYPNKYYFSRDGRIKELSQFNPNDGMSQEMAMRICRIPIPYLIIKGGASTNPSALAKDLDDLLIKNNDKFELHVVPNATHHLHLNTPEPVAEIILPFLRKHLPVESLLTEESQTHRKAKL